MPNVIKALFSSRKFVGALTGVFSCFLMVLVGDSQPLIREAMPYLVLAVIALVGSYIGGTAYEDGQAKRAELVMLSSEEAKDQLSSEIKSLVSAAIDALLDKDQSDEVKG